jgi:hypothetical protein
VTAAGLCVTAVMLPALWVPALAAALPMGIVPVDSALPVGTFVLDSSSSTMDTFTVTCSGVRASLGGTLLIQRATGSPRGLVMFFSGSYGTTAWSTNSSSNTWLTGLAAAGYEVVQLEWSAPGWEPAGVGEDAGQAHVACRPATAIRWVHDNLYSSLHVPAASAGVCGFCITGNSGGASQVSYALAYYGLGPILNGVFPTSGPPHAAIAKGCVQQAGYDYGPLALQIIDSSNGYFNGTGPCSRHDSTFTARWNQESVDTNGSSYYYGTTRVHFIFGASDTQTAKQHAEDYIARLTGAGSPMVSQQTITGMAHEVTQSGAGLAALLAAIEAGASPAPSPTPPASPSPTPVNSPGATPSAGGVAFVSPRPSPRIGGSPSPGSTPRQSPSPGADPSIPATAGLRGLESNITKGGASHVALWIVVVGLAFVLAALTLIPRLGLVRRVAHSMSRAPRRRPPPG